jgi:phosphatidylserine decarboxylase|uniref:Phosphatidylserine decarboxylase proenzyme n=1 Tax=Desulfomonile tiedjei TaxID=2358 RepID=A0A7C4AQA9_9BACT
MISRTGHYEYIAREAYPFLIPIFLASVAAWWWAHPWASILFLGLGVATACFFRNPERAIPQQEGVIVAPADGVIAEIAAPTASENLPNEPLVRISTFMSIFNVHVNRFPVAGTVKKIQHVPGRFLDARKSEASSVNERNSVVIGADIGDIEVVQVAGKIARRIACWIYEGDSLKRGDRFGLIRFGSRVDVFIPSHLTVSVTKGQKVVGGVTVIAQYPSPQSSAPRED